MPGLTFLGINNASVARLHHTLAQLPQKSLEIFSAADQLIQTKNNYKNYRTSLRSTPLPLIPYLGIFLTDLTFAEDGNKDFVERKEELTEEDKTKVPCTLSQITCPECSAEGDGSFCDNCGYSLVDANPETQVHLFLTAVRVHRLWEPLVDRRV